MRVTLHRKKQPEFASREEHDRYYAYLVVKPLAVNDSDILGHYRTRRQAEQAAKALFQETPPQVMSRHAFQQLATTNAETVAHNRHEGPKAVN